MKTITATLTLTLLGLVAADSVTGETEYSAETLMVAIDNGRDDSVLLVPLEHGGAYRIQGPCNPNVHSARYE